ncbi:amidase [Microlunatus endophyticus]|uniref:N-acetylmuramoyl-L-alanine amidase n=1 Tax=Microlunatus endophyticus TaxID=1716077 RepID=A0A917RZH9_9ACTN|nr:peptidoglycan recognition family protein [Microlunatus endophyticus]GGL46878.1 amidase [Microlunatus endophyticus]
MIRSVRWRGSSRRLAAGATALAAIAAVGLGTAAQAHADPAVARATAFAQASKEFGVPESLLEALSYSQTLWDAHDGQHNTDGGYGPMNLIDGTLFADDGAGKTAAAGQPTSVDSLGQAATLLGVGRNQVRTNPVTNIRGGAALLAHDQKSLGLATGADTDPGQWYAAVAKVGGSADQSTARTFADDVYAALAGGASRTTDDGTRVTMVADRTTPRTAQLSKLKLAGATQSSAKKNPNVECPASLDCEWIPAPYEQYGTGSGDYGNYDLAPRDTPAGPTVDYIVLHDTEASWDTTLQLVQDPTYLGWHYSIRSSDGQVAQHIATKNVGWHAGNWYINQHSIGVEQEGFAAQGATWFSESLYRNSARLVRYLAQKWNIPLDRAHILGHDNVPGINAANVAGMHWDPGPYWNWEHYFDLLGAPLQARHGKPSSQIVRILPGFDDNQQPVTGCTTVGQPCDPQGTNFVYLHTEPSQDSPLVKDIDMHAGGDSTTDVADVAARAAAGQDYAVAGRSGNWTAIWYLGQQAWFYNPKKHPTAIAYGGYLIKPKPGVAAVTTYGRAYPESSAYPAGIPDQGTASLDYQLLAGQSAVLSDATVSTDYYRAVTFDGTPPTDHIDIRGTTKYLQISFGHRIMYVKAADVDIVPAR